MQGVHVFAEFDCGVDDDAIFLGERDGDSGGEYAVGFVF